MVRTSAFLLFAALVAAQTPSQRATLDPAFDRVPFDQWLSEPSNSLFRWKTRVSRAELSFHQRLMATVEIEVDGADLQNRRANGRLVFLVQITDRAGTRYQHHDSIELSKLGDNIKAANIQLSQSAFFLPGDYRLAVAAFDTATLAHNIIQTQFRVGSASDFLAEEWRDLPPIEFIDEQRSPESWYLPAIQDRLEWAARAHSPARLSVILNLTPPLTEPGSHPIPSSGLAALLPTFKILTRPDSSLISENIRVIDLGRRRAVFSQNDATDLAWPSLKTSLGNASTASIDLHSLAERHHDAQFFVSEVRNAIRASEKPSVLVVLTTAVAFESGEDLDPISLEALPPCRVIYIRYRNPLPLFLPFEMRGSVRPERMGGPLPRRQINRDVFDQLAATLKPLHPKIFDVETAEEMTKALKEIRNELLAN